MPRLGARRLLFPFAEVRKRCFSVSAFRSFFQPALPLKLSYSIDDSTTKRRLSHSHTSNPVLKSSILRLYEPHTPTALDDKCGHAEHLVGLLLVAHLYIQQNLRERDESRRPPRKSTGTINR
jgi:hypothetical protein